MEQDIIRMTAASVADMRDEIEAWYREKPERREAAENWYKEIKEREVQKWD